MNTEKTAKWRGCIAIFRLILFTRKRERKQLQANARMSLVEATHFGNTPIVSLNLLLQTIKRISPPYCRKSRGKLGLMKRNLAHALRARSTTNTFRMISITQPRPEVTAHRGALL